MIGWISGSRRGQRGVWLAGAVLMAVVLAKLVLVDRQHLGNLLGIGSFIAYGLLCTLVPFASPAGQRVGLTYLYKQGTFYPFAPTGEQQRDTLLELSVRDVLDQELPMEPDLQRWLCLCWGCCWG